MTRKPVSQIEAGRAHYAQRLPAVDAQHFAALWHLVTIGHLVSTDLDAIANLFGCSFADLDLLGTLSVDESKEMRATDLASALYLSEAAVSVRVKRLVAAGLIVRRRADGRAYRLAMTPRGRAALDEAIAVISREAKIARFMRQMPTDDKRALDRILGDLHQRFDREFAGGPYDDG